MLCDKDTALHVYKEKASIPVVVEEVCRPTLINRKMDKHRDRYAQIPTREMYSFTTGGAKVSPLSRWTCQSLHEPVIPPAILFTVHPLNLHPLLLSLSLVADRQLISALLAKWLTFTAVAVLSRKVK